MNKNMTNLSWDDCPNEVLWQILKKLEEASLFICLQVSEQWKAVAYYVLTKKYGGLEHTVKNVIEDVGYLFKKKSRVNAKDSYLNSLLWYNVSNATVKYFGSCGKRVKYISTYRDCLIIVDDYGISFCGMEKNELRWRIKAYNCLTFDHSDNFVVTTGYHATEMLMLAVFAKRDNHISASNGAVFRTSVVVFRIFDGLCYVVDNKGYILCIGMDESRKYIIPRRISRFYGCVYLIMSMHVIRDHITYIMLRTGVVLRCNKMNPGPLHNCGLLCLYSPYGDWLIENPLEGIMFQFGTVMEVGPNDEFTVQYNEAKKFLSILCPRLVCACHHGNVVLIGYNDGKINIFIKRKLEKGNLVPERTIDVYDYYTGPFQSKYRHIRQIKVYEAFGSHILCIITDSITVRLLVENLDLITSDAENENMDVVCLSMIHLLNIVL